MTNSQEFDAFTALVDRVLSVPHSAIKQRVDEQRKRALLNPNRPGPKPKQKPVKASASGRVAKS